MLTLVESLSLAGDRAKQNDDAHGALGACAWVIDGATDMHELPQTRCASDAAWIAGHLNAELYQGMLTHDGRGPGADVMRRAIASASGSAAKAFNEVHKAVAAERWRLPTASLLMVSEVDARRLIGVDLGDCRCFALDATGNVHSVGGFDGAADREAQAAAEAGKRVGGAPLLRDAKTMLWLREQRAAHNLAGSYWVFGLQPECADHAREWSLELARPAHVLLCTDGFSSLVDRYAAFKAGDLVAAARDKGLQELGRELRAIEAEDRVGSRHPRFKPSDDATAVLLRLT